MDNIIEVKHIDKIYGKAYKTQVLFDINLEIKRQSFNSIIGQSGSGKSTLLNIISSLDKPTNGEAYIDGELINNMNKRQLAKIRSEKIGFVFQFHYLLPEFTALENVLMPLKISGKTIDKSLNDKACDLMESLGLSDVKDNMASNMSGGQQQRTAIARALITDPEIIFADEPTGNLDSDTSEQIYELLREINKKYKTTFILITHDRRIAEKADRIIEIKDGKIAFDTNMN